MNEMSDLDTIVNMLSRSGIPFVKSGDSITLVVKSGWHAKKSSSFVVSTSFYFREGKLDSIRGGYKDETRETHCSFER